MATLRLLPRAPPAQRRALIQRARTSSNQGPSSTRLVLLLLLLRGARSPIPMPMRTRSRSQPRILRTSCSRRIRGVGRSDLPRWLRKRSRLRQTPRRTEMLGGRTESDANGAVWLPFRCSFRFPFVATVPCVLFSLSTAAVFVSDAHRVLLLFCFVCGIVSGRRRMSRLWSGSLMRSLCGLRPRLCTSRQDR